MHILLTHCLLTWTTWAQVNTSFTKHFKLLEDITNCCLFHRKGICWVFTLLTLFSQFQWPILSFLMHNDFMHCLHLLLISTTRLNFSRMIVGYSQLFTKHFWKPSLDTSFLPFLISCPPDSSDKTVGCIPSSLFLNMSHIFNKCSHTMCYTNMTLSVRYGFIVLLYSIYF